MTPNEEDRDDGPEKNDRSERDDDRDDDRPSRDDEVYEVGGADDDRGVSHRDDRGGDDDSSSDDRSNDSGDSSDDGNDDRGEAKSGDAGGGGSSEGGDGRGRNDQRRDRRDRRRRRDRGRDREPNRQGGEVRRDDQPAARNPQPGRDAPGAKDAPAGRDAQQGGRGREGQGGGRDGGRDRGRDGGRDGGRDRGGRGDRDGRQGGRDGRGGRDRDEGRKREPDGGRGQNGGGRRDERPEPRREIREAAEDLRDVAARGADDLDDAARPAGIVRDVTRAGRHEPTPDELMPPDDDVLVGSNAPEEPDGKSWELIDSEFGDAESRSRRRRDRNERGRREVEELGAGSSGIDILDPPRPGAERRRRSVEPGLTLRDLIPFLRPPRHVVVAGCGTGAGHVRVARVMAEGIKQADRNAVVRETDLLDALNPEYRAAYVRSVLDELTRRPALYGAPFEANGGGGLEGLPEDLDSFLLEAFSDKFRSTLLDKRPDVLVLTHWLPLRRLEAEAAAGATLPKIVVVAAESEFHRYWWSPVVKAWLAPNAEFERRLIAAGAPEGSTTVVGMPVSPQFAENVDRDAVRAEHGLKRESTTVLFRPAGSGDPARTTALCGRLLAAAAPLNLLVVCGKNDALVEELGRLEVPEGCVLKAFGFVERIHDLMAVSDLLVTRPSAMTVAEAAAMSLPTLLLRPASGAEERTADRLLASGAAAIARDEEQLESELADLSKNRRRIQAMRERARQADRPDTGGRAVDRLLRALR